MRIERNDYLEAIKPVMHNGLVKVVTGVRRCGKSYFLFHIFREWLRESGVDDSQVVAVQLDDDDFAGLRTPRALSRYIKERLPGDGRRVYVLIDEIQECKPPKGEENPVTFYDVLNSLMKKDGVDVYVTGSNSEMLSEDIATNFRDRGTVIRMWPLSFAELLAFTGSDKTDAWEDYLVWGGMPLAVLERRRPAREAYLRGLFERRTGVSGGHRGAIRNPEPAASGSGMRRGREQRRRPDEPGEAGALHRFRARRADRRADGRLLSGMPAQVVPLRTGAALGRQGAQIPGRSIQILCGGLRAAERAAELPSGGADAPYGERALLRTAAEGMRRRRRRRSLRGEEPRREERPEELRDRLRGEFGHKEGIYPVRVPDRR